MKINTSLLFCLFFTLISSCTLNESSIKNGLTKENLRGDVILTVEEFQSESNKSMKIKEFNESGYIIREFESNNSSSSLIEYNYEDNKLITRNSTSSDGEMKSTENSLYEYNKDGRLSMETIINNNKQRTNEYVYDGDRLIKIIQDKNTITNYFYSNYLDSTKTEHLPSLIDGEEYKMVVIYCYNDKEHLVKEIIRNYHNNKCDSFAVLNKYDSEGNMTSRVTEGKTDSLLISYTYDSKRNWILKKASRGSNIEYISTRKVFYSGDEITSYFKIFEDFKRNVSDLNSNKNQGTSPGTQLKNSIEAGGSFNQNNSDNQSSSSSHSRKCSECNGTGKCRTCGEVFRTHYWDGKYRGWKSGNETRPGQVMCYTCKGAGVTYGAGISRPEGPETKKCYVAECRNGWKYCNDCNYEGRGKQLGVCKRCKGTGSN